MKTRAPRRVTATCAWRASLADGILERLHCQGAKDLPLLPYINSPLNSLVYLHVTPQCFQNLCCSAGHVQKTPGACAHTAAAALFHASAAKQELPKIMLSNKAKLPFPSNDVLSIKLKSSPLQCMSPTERSCLNAVEPAVPKERHSVNLVV